ncbi:MAG: hypothetical protein V1755_08430 [Chloroflexota bacterium]
MMQPNLLQRLVRKLDKTLASLFFIDQWVILTGRGMDFTSLRWEAFTALVPDKDRYWGDPFVLQREGRSFVFIEQKLYATGRGHIACLELDADDKLVSQRVVLERDYHLSYPFVFEHGGTVFMVPESAASRRVELYRCVQFPGRWEFVKVLLDDTYAVDATLLEHGGKSWLFANVKEQGGSSLNALHLYWAESPLDGTWNPHPGNPVVRDIASARPAGRIFKQGGQLIRPSQDSTRRYGGALKFNRITRLDKDNYSEEPVSSFGPGGGRIRATHTFNQAGGLTVIDAVIRRPQ